MESTAKLIRVEIPGQDWLELHLEGPVPVLKGRGCFAFETTLQYYRALLTKPFQDWPMPSGTSHVDLLFQELILKARGEFAFPYPHEELCHCRGIATTVVDRAIVRGAHTPEKVSRLTSASTACGTCRSDVQKLIDFRVRKSQPVAGDEALAAALGAGLRKAVS
jgi:bacterioferritin-associated ferredoxin